MLPRTTALCCALWTTQVGLALGAFSGVPLVAPDLMAQGAFHSNELGFTFRAPRSDWQKVGPRAHPGGGQSYEFLEPSTGEGPAGRRESDSCVVGLIVWTITGGPTLEELCDSELEQVAARFDVRAIAREPRQLRGLEGLSIRYRLEREGGEPAVLVDATYVWTGRLLARLSVTVPEDRREELEALVSSAVGGLVIEKGLEPVGAKAPRGERASGPVVFGEPEPDHVLTIVHESDGDALPFRFLEALPGAARANGGLPVVLAIRQHLGDAARSFLRKYRPGRIRLLGPALEELPQARIVEDHAADASWPEGSTVVVSARELKWAVQAGCLALRLGVPLVVDGEDLEERLATLRPARVLVLGGDSAVPVAGADVRRIDGPLGVARAAGGADYIALTNVAAGARPQTAALGALLAGLRGGVVLPIEMPMTRHRIPLSVTAECPVGLENLESAGRYLTGRFKSDKGWVTAGAPQTSFVRVASNDAPRYGRLRIDLDGDGILEETEERRIGSSVNLGGHTYHLTYHYAHPFVPYQRSEILLDEFEPEAVRATIRSTVASLGGVEHLAIIGSPACVPFCYREATGYFEAYDIKQELASDAPYGDLDGDEWRGPMMMGPGDGGGAADAGWDGHLELAVGRVPIEDLVEGSAIVAATVSYPSLRGSWLERATAVQPGFYEMGGSLPWVLPNAEALIRGIGGDLRGAGLEVTGFYRDKVAIDDVIAAMARSGWIAYFNHSGPSAWGIHPGSSIVTRVAHGASDRVLPSLDGAPIVFGGGCSSAALDVGRPLGSTFVGRFFQLGAVAYLGNTRVASARSEHLVQEFFARLTTGDCSVGQAYRDSRNLLAYLLRGGHLVGPLDQGIETGLRDFLWGQNFILNLFADPALRPRLPAGHSRPIEVSMHSMQGEDSSRLSIENRGEEREDPIMMMPAAGQGTPREFLIRTGPGMTSSHLPRRFVGESLEPIRSIPEIGPGVWVDEPLPHGARVVDVTLDPHSIEVSGPAPGAEWFDRGFSVVRGAHGEPRLEMFVPLVRASVERCEETVARGLAFDVRLRPSSRTAGGDAVASFSRPHVVVEPRWKPVWTGPARVSEAAGALLEQERSSRVRVRHWLAGARIEWTLGNPQPRLYGKAARLCGSWTAEGRARVEARGLGETLRARRETIEEALSDVASLPFGDPLPSLAGMKVDLSGEHQLLITPLSDRDGQESWAIDVATDGTVERIVHRRFGLAEETDYEWRDAKEGPLLVRRVQFDRARPEEKTIHEVVYESRWGYLLPERITLRLPGKLPREYSFPFEYLSLRTVAERE